MKSSLNLVLTYGFEVLGLEKVIAHVHEANSDSIYLLHSLGFEKAGLLSKPGYPSVIVYSLKKDAFNKS